MACDDLNQDMIGNGTMNDNDHIWIPDERCISRVAFEDSIPSKDIISLYSYNATGI